MSPFITYLLTGAVILFIVLIAACFIRAVIGPTVADRIVCINMIGTYVIMIIAVLTILLHESWLADIASIYAMISFLAVVVLTKIYIGVYREAQNRKTDSGTVKKDRSSKNKKGTLKEPAGSDSIW